MCLLNGTKYHWVSILGGDLWQAGVDRFVNYNLLSLHLHGYIWDLI